MVKIVISDNDGTTTVVPLVRDEISIGRKKGNTIRLTERNVSREHARLRRSGDKYDIQDLESYNGTLVNGRVVEGEAQIQPGDEVRIGDYSITVQEDGVDAGISRPSDHAQRISYRPRTPARLVMLGDPSPGAEFSLPMEGTVALGRSEDLQIPINHRSVSREHAEIVCEAANYSVRDCESANGVNINGKKVSEHALRSGDVMELGQVMFRFVEPGEHYFFDPNDAAKYAHALHQRSQANTRMAAVLLASAVLIALFLLNSGPEPEEEDANEVALVTGAPVTPAATTETERRQADGYAVALAACNEALEGGRFAEAMAHAAMALKARPADPIAFSCQAHAQRKHDDEQVFLRGKAALERGDLLGAQQEFAGLADDSTFRTRPEVAEATTRLAAQELDEGRKAVTDDPDRALQAARRVLALPGIDASVQEGALVLAEEAKRQLARATAPSPTKSSKRSRRSRKSRATRTRQPSEPSEPVPAPIQPGAALEEAKSCLARVDNQCAIRALAGKASTPKEMALLIETYRAVGNSQAATKYMGLYIKRFPSAQKAGAYRQTLARQER